MAETERITQPESGRPWRVLVVENDPTARADHIHNLRNWGFEVYPAQGIGDELLTHALQQARLHRCHVAVVDMRLLIDSDPNDSSGLSLARKLLPLPVIVVSSHGTKQRLRDAFVEAGVEDFVGKADGPKKLKKVLERVVNELTPPLSKYELEFKPPLNIGSIVSHLGFKDADELTEELQSLIAQTLPDTRRLVFELVPSLIMEAHTILLLAHLDQKERILLRLDTIARTEDEEKKHQQFSNEEVATVPYRLRSKFRYSWNLGCTVYEFSGLAVENLTTLAAFYRQGTVEQITRSIKNAFWAWTFSYLSTKLLAKQLIDEYLSKRDRLLLENNPVTSSSLSNQQSTYDLPDPISWVTAHADESQGFEARGAFIHGLFTADSILIDPPSEEVYQVDFSNAGWGHLLRDFCLLEADILLRLADLTDDYLCEMVVALTRVREIGEPFQITERLFRHRMARKTFDILVSLRGLSLEISRYGDQQEYYWALLLTAIKLTSSETSTTILQKRARLYGAILCARLEQWDEDTWSESRWPAIQWMSQSKRRAYEADIRYLHEQRAFTEQQIAAYTSVKAPPDLLQEYDRTLSELAKFGEILES